MKYVCVVAACAPVVGASACHAQGGVDKAKATAFDARLFGGPLSQKTDACFVRRYDANHLAQHPKQKVSAMKLLVTAKDAPEDKTVNYSSRLGFKYRHRGQSQCRSVELHHPSPNVWHIEPSLALIREKFEYRA